MRIKILILGFLALICVSCDTLNLFEDNINLHIQGTVTWKSDNTPEAGSSVRLMHVTGWDKSEVLASATTNESGYYSLKHKMKTWECSEKLIWLEAFDRWRQHYGSESDVRCINAIQTINIQLGR